MTSIETSIAASRLKAWTEAGYGDWLVILAPGDKRPIEKGWNDPERIADIGAVRRKVEEGANLGLRLDERNGLIALDIEDSPYAEMIEQAARRRWGGLWFRRREKSRSRACLLRCPGLGVAPKLINKDGIPTKGERRLLAEVLAGRRQLMIEGWRSDAGAAVHWDGEGVEDYGDLVLTTEAEVVQFFDDVMEELDCLKPMDVIHERVGALRERRQYASDAVAEGPIDVVRGLLGLIPINDIEPRLDWINLSMAVSGASGKSEEGWLAWKEWCDGWHGVHTPPLEQVWASLNSRELGIDFLYQQAFKRNPNEAFRIWNEVGVGKWPKPEDEPGLEDPSNGAEGGKGLAPPAPAGGSLWDRWRKGCDRLRTAIEEKGQGAGEDVGETFQGFILARPSKGPAYALPRINRTYCRGQVAMVGASPYTGKSLLTVLDALAIVTERPDIVAQEDKDFRRCGNVVVVSNEDGAKKFKSLIDASMIGHGLTYEDYKHELIIESKRLALATGGGSFTPTEDACALLDRLAEVRKQLGPVALLVIDTLASSVDNVEENAVREMQPFMNMGLDLAQALHAAVVIIHHAVKVEITPDNMSLSLLRGSGAIGAAARTVRMMAQVDETRAERLGFEQGDRIVAIKEVKGEGQLRYMIKQAIVTEFLDPDTDELLFEEIPWIKYVTPPNPQGAAFVDDDAAAEWLLFLIDAAGGALRRGGSSQAPKESAVGRLKRDKGLRDKDADALIRRLVDTDKLKEEMIRPKGAGKDLPFLSRPS